MSCHGQDVEIMGPLLVKDLQTEGATVCDDGLLCRFAFVWIFNNFTHFYRYFVHFLCLRGSFVFLFVSCYCLSAFVFILHLLAFVFLLGSIMWF